MRTRIVKGERDGQPDLDRMMREAQAAVAAGTHSTRITRWCDTCRQPMRRVGNVTQDGRQQCDVCHPIDVIDSPPQQTNATTRAEPAAAKGPHHP